MATPPKSLSVQDLTSAIHAAVGKVKLPPNYGLVINPGIICGILIESELSAFRQAQEVAGAIARQVSAHTGVTVAPVVQQASAAATEHAAPVTGLKPGHLIMGYRPEPEDFIRF